jgi:uncharacterized membrane protein YdjX (TVP38/TMEM64 family)
VRLRGAVLVAVVLAGFLLFRMTPLGELLTEERMTTLIGEVRGVWWSPVLLLALYLVLAPMGMPMSPLIVAGAVFGVRFGSLYNLTGLFFGAVASYGLARLLGRDFVLHLSGERLRRAEGLMERHGFWPLVQTRFLPLPFPVVNYGAALAGVDLPRFVAASVVGLVPSTLMHTFFIAMLFESSGGQRIALLVTYAAVFLLVNVILSVVWVREKPERGTRLREAFRQRFSRTGRFTRDDRGV